MNNDAPHPPGRATSATASSRATGPASHVVAAAVDGRQHRLLEARRGSGLPLKQGGQVEGCGQQEVLRAAVSGLQVLRLGLGVRVHAGHQE